MTQRQAHSRVAFLVAALHLALSLGLGLNLVVCRSATRHVAVESSLNDCCTNSAQPEPSRSLLPDWECDGCTDTPLLQTVLQRDAPSNLGALPPPQLLCVGNSPPDLSLAPFVLGVWLADSAPPDAALSARPSVVLLV